VVLALMCLAIWLSGLIAWHLDFTQWPVFAAVAGYYLLRSFRCLGWMPFVSVQTKRFYAYLGWRERGNFGIKANLSFKETA